jgi:hypothetical protein
LPPENGLNSRQLYLRQNFATEPASADIGAQEVFKKNFEPG